MGAAKGLFVTLHKLDFIAPKQIRIQEDRIVCVEDQLCIFLFKSSL